MADPFSILPIQDGGLFMVRSIRFQSVEIDTTPDPLVFTNLVDQSAVTFVESETLTVSGLSDTVTSPISIDFDLSDSTASLSVNGGPFAQTTVNVSNGDTVQLRVRTADTNGTLVRVVLNAGPISSTWLVTTSGAIEIPDSIAFSRLPYIVARSMTVAAVAFTATEAGQYRVIVTAAGQHPQASEILAGVGQGGVNPIQDSGLLAHAALTEEIVAFTGLTAGTNYAFHVAVRDELGNYTESATVTGRTTLPVTPNTNRLLATIATPITRPQSTILKSIS